MINVHAEAEKSIKSAVGKKLTRFDIRAVLLLYWLQKQIW